MDEKEVVAEYLRRLQNLDVEGLLDLFGEECAIDMPLNDDVLRGKDKLRAFYTGLLGRWERATVTPGAVLYGDSIAMAEFTFDLVLTDGGTLNDDTVDVFHLGPDGKISLLQAYTDTYPLRKAFGMI